MIENPALPHPCHPQKIKGLQGSLKKGEWERTFSELRRAEGEDEEYVACSEWRSATRGAVWWVVGRFISGGLHLCSNSVVGSLLAEGSSGQSGKGTERDRKQPLGPTCLGGNKRCIKLRWGTVRTQWEELSYAAVLKDMVPGARLGSFRFESQIPLYLESSKS